MMNSVALCGYNSESSRMMQGWQHADMWNTFQSINGNIADHPLSWYKGIHPWWMWTKVVPRSLVLNM